jgi:hypothetical protein
MYDVVVLLSQHVDRLVKRAVPTYQEGLLFRELSKTKKIKGRLLYYYPTDSDLEGAA